MANEKAEPFPTVNLPDDQDAIGLQPASNDESRSGKVEGLQGGPLAMGHPRRTRGSSLIQNFVVSNPPLGMWQATGEVGSKIPTLPEIRDGSFGVNGWSQEGQMEHRGTDPHEIHRRVSRARRSSSTTRTNDTTAPRTEPSVTRTYPQPATVHEESVIDDEQTQVQSHPRPAQNLHTTYSTKDEQVVSMTKFLDDSLTGPDETGTYPNGYRFPKKHTWSQSTAIGLKALWNFVLTPMGFIITIYGLNVVGWGAMIFFVLLEAAPAMCHPSCNDDYSARKIWIEIDSQVLTALFCVTGFGLIPWRFRDFYYLMRWRVGGNWRYHRKLAGIYRGWYRLPGSNKLSDNVAPPPVYTKKNPPQDSDPPPYSAEEIKELEDNNALPLPATSIPDPPLTGIRAQPTKAWNLDVVIWMYLWNTLIQAALAGIMWGMNRFNRPSWATGFLISIGCITGIVAGVVVFIEGSKVKKVEGIPVKEYDVVESTEDYQQRKAREDAKEAKRHARQTIPDEPQIARTEKIKGASWFTRH